VSVAVVMITFGGFFKSIHTGMQLIQGSREDVRANQILVEKMETLRLYTYDQLTTPGFIPPTFSVAFQPFTMNGTNSSGFTFNGTITITNSPVAATYSDDLRLVTVNLTWTSDDRVHTRQISTLVGRNALQSYIY
jgi:hypothetical protein